MIVIRRKNEIIHSDSTQGVGSVAISPILSEEVNKVPSLQFQIAVGNNVYDSIKNGDVITVEEDGNVTFNGRVNKVAMNFQKLKTVNCVGEFDFLNDTIIRPFEKTTGTVRAMLDVLIISHNACADSDKQFVVGDVEALTTYEFVNENYVTTMEFIQESIINEIGGQIYFDSDTNGNRRINYRYIPLVSEQLIMYGSNMLDFQKSVEQSDIFTVLVPVGKDGLTIKDINQGYDFVVNADAVEQYGKIWKVEQIDTDDVNELYRIGLAHVNAGVSIIPSMSIKAFDLKNMGTGIEAFAVGQFVNIYSEVHDLNVTMEVQKIKRNILNPTNSEITIGSTAKGMTSQVQKAESRIEKEAKSGIGYPVERKDLAVDVQQTLNASDVHVNDPNIHVTENEKNTWNSKCKVSEGNTVYWNETNKTYIPEKNEIIIYIDYFVDERGLVPNIKIGDGLAYVVDLPFVAQNIAEELNSHMLDGEIHVSAADRLKWDNKVACLIYDEEERLLFYT